MRDEVGFQFDPEHHIYTLGQRRLPSVTEIVGVSYAVEYIGSTDWHMQQGRMTHLAISMLLQGVLDEATVDERIAGKIAGAKLAIKELGITPLLVETRMYHKTLFYAGTFDCLTDYGVLIDWKSRHSELATPPQLGGYAGMLEQEKYKVKEGLEIVLNENGSYTPYYYDIRLCKRLFTAGYTVWGHKQKTGG